MPLIETASSTRPDVTIRSCRLLLAPHSFHAAAMLGLSTITCSPRVTAKLATIGLLALSVPRLSRSAWPTSFPRLPSPRVAYPADAKPGMLGCPMAKESAAGKAGILARTWFLASIPSLHVRIGDKVGCGSSTLLILTLGHRLVRTCFHIPLPTYCFFKKRGCLGLTRSRELLTTPRDLVGALRFPMRSELLLTRPALVAPFASRKASGCGRTQAMSSLRLRGPGFTPLGSLVFCVAGSTAAQFT